MDLKAVVKLLEDEGCLDAAERLKTFINSKQLLPPRVNTLGTLFNNTFENFESIHSNIKPSVLIDYFKLLMSLVYDRDKCASHAGTLIGLQGFQKKHKQGNKVLDQSSADYRRSCKMILNSLHHLCSLDYHLLAHRTAIYCLEYDKRGDFAFTGSDDYTIKIWSLRGIRGGNKPKCVLRHTLRGHVAEIIELAVSTDNHLLASIDSNSCLVLWCLRTGQPILSVRGSRSNRVLSGLSFLNIPLSKCNQNANFLSNFQESSYSGGQVSGILAVTSFGGYLHLIPFVHNTQPMDSLCNRWTCCSIKLLPTIRFTTAPEGTPNVFWPSISCMDTSPGGLLLAAGCSDQKIRLYQFLNPLKPEAAGVLAAHEEGVNSVAFSHSGLKLATGSSDGGSCWLWRLQAGQWRSMVLQFRKRVKCRPCLLVWSKYDQYLIASMKNGSVYIYFGHSGHLAAVIEGHEGAIHAVSPSPFDENIFATGGVDGRFQLWNISSLRRYYQIQEEEEEGSSHTIIGRHKSCMVQKPLLYHYRYPPGQLDLMQGLVWRFLDPSDNQPIWPNSNNKRASSTVRDNLNHARLPTNLHDSNVTSETVQENSSQTWSIRSNISRPSLNRTGSGSTTKMQRITACRPLPSVEGIGFLVVTKSGLMSLFRSVDPCENINNTWTNNNNQTTLHDLETNQIDEQFLHWELDTAEWKEVNHSNENNFSSHISEQTLHILGSPPAPQTAAALPGGRMNLSGSVSNPNVIISNSPDLQSDNILQQRNSMNDSIIRPYVPPPTVLYEIVHAPSRVPFHRLPPAYLTNLRGFPHVSKRQVEVPGREHLSRPLDLLPSVTLDEETGEDIVVDDIQFCHDVPSDYCPVPVSTNVNPIPNKNYLWCSAWLTDHNSLIEPLDSNELSMKLDEQLKKFNEEASFFKVGGEPLISFGDEFTNSKIPLSSSSIIFMQPEHSSINSIINETENRTDSIITNEINIPSDSVSNTNSKIEDHTNSEQGLSFIHTFLSKTKKTDSSNVKPGIIESNYKNGTYCLPLNSISTTLQTDSNIQSTSLPTDEIEDLDEPDDTSEESEWSETVDVDIGWWNRQRRRRYRRQVNGNEGYTNDSQHATINNLLNTELGLDEDDAMEAMISPGEELNETSMSSNQTEFHTNGPNSDAEAPRCRRSLRQRRRLIAKRRLLREAKLAEANAARVEIEKQRAVARRSRRFLAHSGDENNIKLDEDSTSRDTCLPESSGSRHIDSHPSTSTQMLTTAVDNVTSQRERLKKQLIRSMDYAVALKANSSSTCSRLPLSRIPLDGYTGPDVLPQDKLRTTSIIPDVQSNPWFGPHFDWLSTIKPIASPYVPQTGDRLVYIYKGHQEYLNKAWESGQLPSLDWEQFKGQNSQSHSLTDEQKVENNSTQLPWIVWPNIPDYLCCKLVKIFYHIVRINGSNNDNRTKTNRQRTKSYHRRHTTTTTQITKRSNTRLRQSNNHNHSKSFKNQINYDDNKHFTQDLNQFNSTLDQPGIESNATTTTTTTNNNNNSSSSSNTVFYDNDDGDSFVRLVSLQLEIESEQSYAFMSNYLSQHNNNSNNENGSNICDDSNNINIHNNNNNNNQQVEPKQITVVYHDVDGILEFLILRHIFDSGISKSWNRGDVFICPVGDVWWRGSVLQPETKPHVTQFAIHNQPQISLSGSLTSTNAVCSLSTTVTGSHNTSNTILNLSYLVLWFEENDSTDDQIRKTAKIHDQLFMNSNHSIAKLPDDIDHLSVWDMYSWFENKPDNQILSNNDQGVYFYGGLSDGYVHISDDQICSQFGTSHHWYLLSNSIKSQDSDLTYQDDPITDMKRLADCLNTIIQLEISEAFVNPVDLSAYPDYLFINPQPVDLTFIMNRLVNGFYRQKLALKTDFELLKENTERYNLPNSQIVYNAQIVYELGLYSLNCNIMPSDVMQKYRELIGKQDLPSNSNCDNVEDRTLESEATYVAEVNESSSLCIKNIDDRQPCTSLNHSISIESSSNNNNTNTMITTTCVPFSASSSSSSSKSSTASSSSSSSSSPSSSSTTSFPTLVSSRRNTRSSNTKSCFIKSSLTTRNQSSLCNQNRHRCKIRKYKWIKPTIELLKKLITNSRSFFFRNPINLNEYPDYLTIIDQPIDLNEILNKLKKLLSSNQSINNLIYCPHRLYSDLCLIVKNAKTYNLDPETQVYDDTIWLENWIENIMKPNLENYHITLNNNSNSNSNNNNNNNSKYLNKSVKISNKSQSYALKKSSRFNKIKKKILTRSQSNYSHLKYSQTKSFRSTRSINNPVTGQQNSTNISSSINSNNITRTSSGRIIKPPLRGPDEICLELYDDDDENEDENENDLCRNHTKNSNKISTNQKRNVNRSHTINSIRHKYPIRHNREQKRQSTESIKSNSSPPSNHQYEQQQQPSSSSVSCVRRSNRKRKAVCNLSNFYFDFDTDENSDEV